MRTNCDHIVQRKTPVVEETDVQKPPQSIVIRRGTSLASFFLDHSFWSSWQRASIEILKLNNYFVTLGKVGRTMKLLVQDFREVMLPNTALKLKVILNSDLKEYFCHSFDINISLQLLTRDQERKANNIKDFLSVAGPLAVSHLAVFSSTDMGAYMRIMKTPQVMLQKTPLISSIDPQSFWKL